MHCWRRSPAASRRRTCAALPDASRRPAVGQPAATDRRAKRDRIDRVADRRAGRAAATADARSSRCPTATPTAPEASRPSPEATGPSHRPRAHRGRSRRRRRSCRRGTVASGRSRRRAGSVVAAEALTAEGEARLRAELDELTLVKRPAGHRPHPDRQGARRPQGERRVPRGARGAVVPRGPRPGDRGAAALGGHRRRAGRRFARRAGFGRDRRTTTARRSRTRSSAPTSRTRRGPDLVVVAGRPRPGRPGHRANIVVVATPAGERRYRILDDRPRTRRARGSGYFGGSTSLCSTA